MKPIEILQGKWLGHPLHPALVHVPIGLWIVALVLDLVNRNHTTAGSSEYLALYCVIGGLLGALAAVPTGAADWAPIKKEKPAWKLGLYHMALNLLAAIVWAANLGLRWKALPTDDPVTAAVILTSAVGTALILISGYIGSRMVFAYGVSVARHGKKKLRRRAERAGARVPAEK